MKKAFIFSLVFLALPHPAAACGPSPSVLLLGLGLLGAALVAIVMIQSNAFRATRDFMRGVTPDRGGPYWLAFGFAVDAGIFALWIASGSAAVFGAYLLIAALPKGAMALSGVAREIGALRAAKAVY